MTIFKKTCLFMHFATTLGCLPEVTLAAVGKLFGENPSWTRISMDFLRVLCCVFFCTLPHRFRDPWRQEKQAKPWEGRSKPRFPQKRKSTVFDDILTSFGDPFGRLWRMLPQLFQICSEKDVTRNTFSKVVFLCELSIIFKMQTWSPTPPRTEVAGYRRARLGAS